MGMLKGSRIAEMRARVDASTGETELVAATN